MLLLPGFGGGADSPLLVRLSAALADRRLRPVRRALPRGRASPGLGVEIAAARALLAERTGVRAWVGRSFGGRVLARMALTTPPGALVLLGFPFRAASGARRPEDEALLGALACPTLVVQGARDPLGPVRALRRLTAANRNVSLEVLPGAAHAFGRWEPHVAERVADWLCTTLRPGVGLPV